METNKNELGRLNSDEWRDLQNCASRLEKSLKDGDDSIDLQRFLPPPDAPHRRVVLHELIKTELEIRYLQGQTRRLEEYIVRYPELGTAESLPINLLYEEYRVRRVHGDGPELEEYRTRFPIQFEGLKRLVEKEPVPLRAGGTARVSASQMRASIQFEKSDQAPAPATDRRDRKAARNLSLLQELNGYEKLDLLGHGEFGEVWKALAPGGVEVALKFITRNLDHEATRRELKALERIKQLHHPFLLQTHSFGMLEGKLTIVMELADGSLNDRFKECQDKGLPAIPTGELVTFFGQAAEALDYLQSQHVSHRDIKPQNLLSLQGFAKVADFGLARGQDEKLEEASVVCGTPYYMAPEVWMQQISSQSDQYGLAATYAHMRIGKPLFTGTFHEIFMHHIGSVPDLDSLPPAERAVLLQALDKKPDQRFPSCVAFAQALKEATTPIGAVVVPDRRRFLKIAAIPAILALATAGYLIANKGSKDDKPSNPAPPPEPKVSWQPKGWEPENEDDIVTDRNTRRFYRRLVRDVGGQKVTMVVVPRTGSTDPKTFYMMENKVWNDLYAVFAASEQSGILFKRYSSPQVGLEKMVSGEQLWRRGALSESHPDPEMAPYFGVEGAKGRLPVFRITVTEAHCFAEWMDGRLPRRKQWLKAAGQGEDTRVGPFTGAATDTNGLAINLRNGPWPVEQGNRDVSIHGCRQMATNGEEWTRDLQGETTVIPLDRKLSSQRVHLLSQSYLSAEPLTFEAMAIPRLKDCTENSVEVTFRVVLEE